MESAASEIYADSPGIPAQPSEPSRHSLAKSQQLAINVFCSFKIIGVCQAVAYTLLYDILIYCHFGIINSIGIVMNQQSVTLEKALQQNSVCICQVSDCVYADITKFFL